MSTSLSYRAGGASVLVSGIVAGGAFLVATEDASAGSWPFAFQFAPAATVDFTTLATPRCTTIGDFNEDGALDLVIAGNGFWTTPGITQVVWLVQGDEPGQFGAPEPIELTLSPIYAVQWVLAAELTGDAHLDLAVVSDDALYVLEGDGRGHFSLIDERPEPSMHRQMIAADFDNDGDVDLAATVWEHHEYWVRYNDGRGHFPTSVDLFMIEPNFLTAADFDGDGWMDVAIAQLSELTVRIMLNDGSGHPVNSVVMPVEYSPTGLVAADFDEDGDVDLAIAGALSDSGSINLLENLGTGSLIASRPIQMPPYSVSGMPWFLAAADFNGDGLLDLAVSEALSNSVKIFPNEGSGTLSFGLPLPIAVGGFPYSILAANVDNDCDFDLVVSNLEGESVSVLLNQTPDAQTCAVVDLTVDALVDMQDVLVVISEWGEQVSSADLNYDGIVNGVDLVAVLANWDTTP